MKKLPFVLVENLCWILYHNYQTKTTRVATTKCKLYTVLLFRFYPDFKWLIMILILFQVNRCSNMKKIYINAQVKHALKCIFPVSFYSIDASILIIKYKNSLLIVFEFISIFFFHCYEHLIYALYNYGTSMLLIFSEETNLIEIN